MSKLSTIRKEGGSRVLPITKFVPSDWKYVKVEEVSKAPDSVTIKIDRIK